MSPTRICVSLAVALVPLCLAADEVLVAEPANTFHLGAVEIRGNARVRVGYGEDNAEFLEGGSADLSVLNLIFDVPLEEETGLAGDISFLFDWSIVRFSKQDEDEVAQAYVRLEELGSIEWLNAKVGRFLIPFGEEYLWFGEGIYDNPLANYSVASPYGWDEGVVLFGTFEQLSRLSYFAHVSTGELKLGTDNNDDREVGIKFSIEPHDNLYLSASYLRSGAVGSEDEIGFTAFGWGGSHPYPVRPEASTTLDDVRAWEIDARVDLGESVELWMAYGEVDQDDGTDPVDDREFEYYILQAVADGDVLGGGPRWLESSYAVVRYSRIETSNSGEGYKFIALNGGDDFGFDTESVSALQLGLGHYVTENVKVVLEYDIFDFDLTDGSEGDTSDRNMLLLDLAVRF